ncbi:hypothetical protein GN286_04175 [Rhodobacteraceae bacterium IMCC15231]|nr:hypothetical protein [Rhodobacteraceae bacterium IMCC15231]
MNIMSNGSFLDEMSASNKQSELVKTLTAAWEKKNTKAARAGGASLMALSLAACGGDDNTPFSQADIDAALTDTSGTAHASVDAAVTSNDADVAAAAAAAVDITTDNDVASAAGFIAGAASVDITSDNDAAAAAGFIAGAASVDITSNDADVAAAVDITTDNAAAVTAALTDASGTVHANVDAAIASNDADIAAAVDITTDNAAATDAAVAAVTDFADLTSLVAAYTGLITPTPATLTANVDTPAMSAGNDSITGTDTTLTAGDVIVDSSSTDSDTLTLNGAAFVNALDTTGTTIVGVENVVANFDTLTNATLNLAGVAGIVNVTANNVRDGSTALVTTSNVTNGSTVNAGTGLAGGLTVTMDAANSSVTVNSAGVTGTTTVTTTGTGAITANSGTDALALTSARGAIDVTAGATAGNIIAASTGTTAGDGNVTINADTATGTVSGTANGTGNSMGDVTVNAAAAATVVANSVENTAVANAAAATSITATGNSVTVTSANAGVVATPTVIAVNGTGTVGQTDTASVSANGVVTLTNNANLEAITLSGNTAAVTYNIAAAEAFTGSGSQNVTISGTAANLALSTVADSNSGTLTANINNASATQDLSLLNVDSVVHAVGAGAGTMSYANGQAVTFAANHAGTVVLDIDDDAAGTTTVGSLNVTLSADTTARTDVNNAADDIDTLNVTASVAQTGLDIRADNTATTGDTIDLAGSVAVTMAATATALSLDASDMTGALTAAAGASILNVTGGSSGDTLTLATATANTSVVGGAGNDGVTGGAVVYLATQTLDGGTGTDTFTSGGNSDVSAATFQNFQVIANGATTFQMTSAQATDGMVFTGAGAVTFDNLGANEDFSTLSFSNAAGNTVISAANTVGTLGAGASRAFTGTDAIDVMTGGTGNDTLIGGGGNDNLTGAAGADALIGGLGNNTYTFNTGDVVSGDTITFNQTVGATETIVTATATDLSLLNGGALLTGLDTMTLTAGATVVASQVTGLTLAANGSAGNDLTVNGTANADTLDLSNVTMGAVTDTIIATGNGDDVITGTNLIDGITGGAGADTMTGGAAADVFTIGNTDSGITVATADTITDFVSGADTIALGVLGVLVNAGGGTTAENYTEAGAAVADFAAAFTAANTAVAAANTTETTATVFYNLQFDATNGYLFEDIDADGDVDQVIILTGIDDTTLAPADIVA